MAKFALLYFTNLTIIYSIMYVKIMSSNNPSNTDLSSISTYGSGIAQATAFRIVKKHTATALRQYGLTCMQWFTIGAVYDAGKKGLSVSELATRLDTTMAYMTTTINLLESRSILKKSVSALDARAKKITVEPKFAKKVPEIESYVRAELRTVLYNSITSEELLAYITVLQKISQK